MIRLHNTKTRVKEDFTPIDPKNVRMYVCGPTVYDRAHLGNGRPVVVFDVLYRLLRHVYGADHVTYVRNFTDVDDKINATALARQRAGAVGTLEQLIHQRTEETIGWYHDDMDALGALRPDHEPRATEYIGPMVAMIAHLIASGHAYIEDIPGAQFNPATDPRHVLFSVRSYKDYGHLSGRSVDDMIAGARVEVAHNKRDPMDFVLWKPSSGDEPGWDSPWGRGRPGWHIECSAMADELLMKDLPESEKSFDIHGGGLDLQFPHHENEIAQSACAHPKGHFARVWMHNEMLQVEGKKMSKSLGNFFTVRDLLEQGYPGEVIRMVYLGTHYSRPMDWTKEKAREAEKTLRKIAAFLNIDPLSKPWVNQRNARPPQEFVDAVSNDLNTSQALTLINEYLKNMDEFALVGALGLLGFKAEDLIAKFSSFEFQAFDNGIVSGHRVRTNGVEAQRFEYLLVRLGSELSARREAAMTSKDFTLVDNLKSALMEAGVEVRMSKLGVELIPGSGFDAAKLEALL